MLATVDQAGKIKQNTELVKFSGGYLHAYTFTAMFTVAGEREV